MWKEAWQILVIATAMLMYLLFEYSLFNELGWQGEQTGNLLITVFAVVPLVGLLFRPSHIDLGEMFVEEENCSSEQ